MARTAGGHEVPRGEIWVPDEAGAAPGNYAAVVHPREVSPDETEVASSDSLETVVDSEAPFPAVLVDGGPYEEHRPCFSPVAVQNQAPDADQSVPASAVCSLVLEIQVPWGDQAVGPHLHLRDDAPVVSAASREVVVVPSSPARLHLETASSPLLPHPSPSPRDQQEEEELSVLADLSVYPPPAGTRTGCVPRETLAAASHHLLLLLLLLLPPQTPCDLCWGPVSAS